LNASAGIGLGLLCPGVSVTAAIENVIKPGRKDGYVDFSPWEMSLDVLEGMKFGVKLDADASAEFGAYW